MHKPNRDLLVLSGRIPVNSPEFDHQVEMLNDLLHSIEGIRNFCIANDIIDVSRNRFITKQHLIQQIINMPVLKPFIFICNKN